MMEKKIMNHSILKSSSRRLPNFINTGEILSCRSAWESRDKITYRNENGVLVHTIAPFAEALYGTDDRNTLRAVIVNAETQKITDEFWGSKNDFNITLFAKAAKGEKFFLYVYDDKSRNDFYMIRSFKCYLSLTGKSEEVEIAGDEEGNWRLVRWGKDQM